MAEFHFYPTIEVDSDGKSEILEHAGYEEDPWNFYYRNGDGMAQPLTRKKGIPSLVDGEEIWDIGQYGLGVKTTIRFAYPKRLKGEGGLLCRKAELGAAIIWVNASLKQMGYIHPSSVSDTETELAFAFDYYFQPGTVAEDVTLEMILYVKSPAEEADIEADEQHLMNESGVSLGTLREVSLSFKDNHAAFPIKQFYGDKEPLWYLQISSWEDPAEDLLSEENVCIYLNTAYKNCPTPNNMKNNGDLLVEIISSAYLMLFHNLTEEQLHSVLNEDHTFADGSISAALAYLYAVMDGADQEKFNTKRIEEQHRALQNTLRRLLKKAIESPAEEVNSK